MSENGVLHPCLSMLCSRVSIHSASDPTHDRPPYLRVVEVW